MTDLQSKIAALPEWPEPITNFDISVREWGHWQMDGRLAALARLALAREWIKDAHGWGCSYDGSFMESPCTCGRDALLTALEVPHE
jgi:hypothetical protein